MPPAQAAPRALVRAGASVGTACGAFEPCAVFVMQARDRRMHARAGTGVSGTLRAAHALSPRCMLEGRQRMGLTARSTDAPRRAPPQVPLAWACDKLRACGLLPAWAGNALVLGTTAFGQAAAIVLYAQAAA